MTKRIFRSFVLLFTLVLVFASIVTSSFMYDYFQKSEEINMKGRNRIQKQILVRTENSNEELWKENDGQPDYCRIGNCHKSHGLNSPLHIPRILRSIIIRNDWGGSLGKSQHWHLQHLTHRSHNGHN